MPDEATLGNGKATTAEEEVQQQTRAAELMAAAETTVGTGNGTGHARPGIGNGGAEPGNGTGDILPPPKPGRGRPSTKTSPTIEHRGRPEIYLNNVDLTPAVLKCV